jgi:hypothetical protein
MIIHFYCSLTISFRSAQRDTIRLAFFWGVPSLCLANNDRHHFSQHFSLLASFQTENENCGSKECFHKANPCFSLFIFRCGASFEERKGIEGKTVCSSVRSGYAK